MAVVISDSRNPNYNGKMSTANAYYQVEAYQLSNWRNENGTAIGTEKFITVTFANAGNCQGIVLSILAASSTQINVNKMKDVTVELQESVAGTWTTRTSVTKTPDQMLNNSTGKPIWTSMHHPFDFATPYAVDTTAGKWRFRITNNATTYPATANTDWYLKAGNNTTVFFHVVWCDNQVSLADGDTLIVKDTIEVDTNRTLNGTLSGASSQAIACIICKSDDPTPSGVCKLKWEASPASSYTLTLKGDLQFESYAGFQAGTSANPIPYAQRGALYFDTPNVGTEARIINWGDIAQNRPVFRTNFMVYGEVPTVRKTTTLYDVLNDTTATFNTGSGGYVTLGSSTIPDGTPIRFKTTGTIAAPLAVDTVYYLAKNGLTGNIYALYPTRADALANTNRITITSTGTGTHTAYGVIFTADTTGWTVGDRLFMNKASRYSTAYDLTGTISYISGNEIWRDTLSQYIYAGGTVSNPDSGYGFKIYSNDASTRRCAIGIGNNLVMSGIEFERVHFFQSIIGTQYIYDPENENRYLIEKSTFISNPTGTSQSYVFSVMTITTKGAKMSDNLFYACRPTTGTVTAPNSWDGYGDGSTNFPGVFTFEDNEISNTYYTGTYFNGRGLIIRNNKWWNINTNVAQQAVYYGTTGLFTSEIHDNYYWGSSGTMVTVGNTANLNWYNETFEEVATCYYFPTSKFINATNKNITLTNVSYAGQVQDGTFTDFEFEDPNANISIYFGLGNIDQTNMVYGSNIRVTNNNLTANFDVVYMVNGNITRTGTSLADTTVHNSGYAMRFESNNTDSRLEWTQKIPTGNIQNKTMVIGAWVKINNANYWAGTHQMPRITVEYDEGTTAYAEAAQVTGWQFIFVPFTPTTTYGQVKLTASVMSDATGTDNYVYFDDFTAPLPQGVELNLGSLDTWANALPITPVSFASSVSGADVWAADPTTFGANTVGDKVNKIKNDTGIIPALL